MPEGEAQNYYEERLTYAQQVLADGIKRNDSTLISEGYYLLGKRAMDRIDNREAYRYFLEAIRINEALRNHYNIGKVYLRLSRLEAINMNHEKSLTYAKQAIQSFSKQQKGKVEVSGFMETAKVFYELAILYPHSSDPAYADSAIIYYHKAEKLFLKDNKTEEIAKVSYRLGNLYAARKDPRANAYFENSIKARQGLVRDFENELRIAEAWLMLNKPQKFKEVIAIPEAQINRGDFILPAKLAQYHTAYTSYYKMIDDWQNALIHSNKAMSFREKVHESNRKDNLNQWRVELETHQKDAELDLRQERINTKQKLIEQQTVFMGILILFFLLLVVLCYFLYQNYTKQKRLSHKNELLLQEQNHRIKNNLQVISSLLNLQREYVKDVSAQKVLTESQTRINSMLLLHKQLYENDNIEFINICDLLTDLAGSIAHSFGVNTIQLNQQMEIDSLKTDVATVVGLIFNELITNSFKYVFAKDGASTIEIISRVGENKMITMEYRDFGHKDLTQIITNPVKKTFGLTLIEMILFQINGTLNYSFQNGSVFTIQFKNV